MWNSFPVWGIVGVIVVLMLVAGKDNQFWDDEEE